MRAVGHISPDRLPPSLALRLLAMRRGLRAAASTLLEADRGQTSLGQDTQRVMRPSDRSMSTRAQKRRPVSWDSDRRTAIWSVYPKPQCFK